MSEVLNLTWDQCIKRAEILALSIKERDWTDPVGLYGIPRGGIHAAQLVDACNIDFQLVDSIYHADVIIDDLYDSGETTKKIQNSYGDDLKFYYLVHKPKENLLGTWVSFPWERMAGETGIEENVTRILQLIGEDPKREGLRDTPTRVARSMKEIYGGYAQDPKEIVRCFEDGTCDEMVVVKGIPVYSMCEHHMLPFFGVAHIGYIPDGRIIGLSKIARIVDVYARRLQVQERLTNQITNCLQEALNPLGVGCVIEAQHFCMQSRGVQKQGSVAVTTALTGVFRERPEVRSEFLSAVRG
jgi:GTP cyclohydrolase I